jgi:hypothetical protein
VSGRDTYRVAEHSVGSVKCALSRKTSGGHEAFLCKKYFELSYSKTQQHKECVSMNLSQVLNLRRSSAFAHRVPTKSSKGREKLSRFLS